MGVLLPVVPLCLSASVLAMELEDGVVVGELMAVLLLCVCVCCCGFLRPHLCHSAAATLPQQTTNGDELCSDGSAEWRRRDRHAETRACMMHSGWVVLQGLQGRANELRLDF